MTVAVDIKTGQVVGQVTDTRAGWPHLIRILTRNGFQDVPRSTVRLENVDSR